MSTKAENPSGADSMAIEAGAGEPEAVDELAVERARVGNVVDGRYLIRELIGLGGMGAVYRAEHVHMRKQVAMKVLHQELTCQPDVVTRFEREAVAAGRIEHPNVVQARDFGRLPDGSYYLVLEYVEGETLSDLLGDGAVMPLPRALNILLQVAAALEAAHAEGIIHRDLKPENVMVVVRHGAADLVKVVDFGIAKLSLPEKPGPSVITQLGVVFGTPEYMSPEQAAGQEVDERGDVYALGLLLYRMLVGRAPFQGDNVRATLMLQITQPLPPLPEQIPPPVGALLEELLRKEPADRLQTAGAARQAVSELMSTLGIRVELPSFSGGVAESDVSSRSAGGSGERNEHRTLAGRLDASVVGVPVQLLGNVIPLWRFIILVSVLTGLGVLLSRLLTAPRPTVAESETTPAAPASSLNSQSDPVLGKQIAKAFAGDEAAVAYLEARSPETRGVKEWLALAHIYAQQERWEQSLEAYARALAEEPELSTDVALRKDIAAATRDSGVAERAARLAAERLGSYGADLLYWLWVGEQEVTKLSTLAAELLRTPSVSAHATPALAVLLEWRAAINCSDYLALLPRVAANADRRAVTLLRRPTQCDDLDEEALTAAVAAARGRPEPGIF